MGFARCAWVVVLGAALSLGAPGAVSRELSEEQSAQVRAFAAFQTGYLLHLDGRYEQAAEMFRESIALHPTAEGHTFLGWSLSELGRLEDAIAECRTAIAIDPDYGNPYNDIGVYLIDLGRTDEAVPWLEKALQARRYCCYEFAHYNLGRIQLLKGDVERARRSFRRALEHEPRYGPALQALEALERGGIRGI